MTDETLTKDKFCAKVRDLLVEDIQHENVAAQMYITVYVDPPGSQNVVGVRLVAHNMNTEEIHKMCGFLTRQIEENGFIKVDTNTKPN